MSGLLRWDLDTLIVAPQRLGRKRAMEYPPDFPEHLKSKVDDVIAAAEVAFIDAKAKRSNAVHEDSLLSYSETVFFGFAQQCVEAGREGYWSGERIRRALREFLDVLIDRTFRDKSPSNKQNSTTRYQFREAALRNSQNWARWREIQQELCDVFQRPNPSSLDIELEQPNTSSNPAVMRDKYLSSFQEKILILDICWAAGQHYTEWKRWINGKLQAGSTPDCAFRAVLSSGKPPAEFKKKPRPAGWI